MQEDLVALVQRNDIESGNLRRRPINEPFDQGFEVGPSQGSLKARTVEEIGHPHPTDMDEDLSLGVAEHEPGITLVGQAAIGFKGHTCAREQELDPCQIRHFLVGPVADRRGRAIKRKRRNADGFRSDSKEPGEITCLTLCRSAKAEGNDRRHRGPFELNCPIDGCRITIFILLNPDQARRWPGFVPASHFSWTQIAV